MVSHNRSGTQQTQLLEDVTSEKHLVTTKTPLRITFTGGGTDLPEYYMKYGPGAVLSAAINSYIYISVSKHFYPDELRVSYSSTENAIKNINDIKHPTVREALRLLDIKSGIQIVSITEIPSKGTGLGSSSSFLVGLLNALHAWKGELTSPKQLAEEAVYIEREVLKEKGGKQDQYMAAYGGINLMEFMKNGEVCVKPIPISTKLRKELESNLIMFYTGNERSSSAIHEKQALEIGKNIDKYTRMREIAYETAEAVTKGEWSLLGKLFNENWLLKKQLSGEITNDVIDSYYSKALAAGASGGKLIGAGGSGFMLFNAIPEKRSAVASALNLQEHSFEIETQGSRVIYVE